MGGTQTKMAEMKEKKNETWHTANGVNEDYSDMANIYTVPLLYCYFY